MISIALKYLFLLSGLVTTIFGHIELIKAMKRFKDWVPPCVPNSDMDPSLSITSSSNMPNPECNKGQDPSNGDNDIPTDPYHWNIDPGPDFWNVDSTISCMGDVSVECVGFEDSYDTGAILILGIFFLVAMMIFEIVLYVMGAADIAGNEEDDDEAYKKTIGLALCRILFNCVIIGYQVGYYVSDFQDCECGDSRSSLIDSEDALKCSLAFCLIFFLCCFCAIAVFCCKYCSENDDEVTQEISIVSFFAMVPPTLLGALVGASLLPQTFSTPYLTFGFISVLSNVALLLVDPIDRCIFLFGSRYETDDTMETNPAFEIKTNPVYEI